MIKGIAHLAFQASDMDASIRFYQTAFGFKPKFTLQDNDGKPWIVYLEIGNDQFIELFYTNQPLVRLPHPTSYQHLCLEVTKISDIAAHLVSSGCPLDHPVSLGKDNNYQCWTHDPDGNPIELMEYGPGSLQKR